MILFPAAGLIGLGYGYLRAGRFSSLASFSVRHVWLVAVAVGLQVGQGHGPLRDAGAGTHRAIVLLSYAAIGTWLVLNARGRPPWLRRALVLVAVGWLLNLAAIALNGGMPVSQSALAYVGEARAEVSQGQLWKHVRASPDAPLSNLGDVIPVPGPIGVRSVISVGDLVMLAGFALTLSSAMTADHRRPAMALP
jgi:hypothetical protein